MRFIFQTQKGLFSIKLGYISKIEGHDFITYFQPFHPSTVSETKTGMHNDLGYVYTILDVLINL